MIDGILSSLWQDMKIEYLYYGRNRLNDIHVKGDLSNWIHTLQEKRYTSFKEEFGEISLDVPPTTSMTLTESKNTVDNRFRVICIVKHQPLPSPFFVKVW